MNLTEQQRSNIMLALLFAVLFDVYINLSHRWYVLKDLFPTVDDDVLPSLATIPRNYNERASEPPYWLYYSNMYQCSRYIENASYTASEEDYEENRKYVRISKRLHL